MGKEYQRKIDNIMAMGFTHEQASNALLIFSGDEQSAVDYLLQSQQQEEEVQSNKNVRSMDVKSNKNSMKSNTQDEELQRALQLSLNNQSQAKNSLSPNKAASNQSSQNHSQANNEFEEFIIQYEPLNAEDRQREDDQPVGLKNVGNTCYFNSLIQSYFFVPSFTQKILGYALKKENQQTNQPNASQDQALLKRSKYSRALVVHLSKLFAQMIYGNRKYMDPTQVLKSLVDDIGNPMLVGEQKDIGEFNLNLIERIEEGLGEKVDNHQEQPVVNNNMSDSMMLQSSSFAVEEVREMVKKGFEEEKQKQKSSLEDIFFGKKLQCLNLIKTEQSFDTMSPQMRNDKKQERLGPIMLDISMNRLYESWDEAFSYEVKDLLVKNNEQSGASFLCEQWILEPPSILFFSLNRVQFDKTAKKIVKCNHYFQFDKEIYADMFLYKNREVTRQMRDNLRQMKNQIKLINQSINLYKQQSESSQPNIYTMLDSCQKFIKQNAEIHPSELLVSDPSQIGTLNFNKNELEITIRVLSQYKEVVSKQIEDLQDQLKQLNHQIDTAFVQHKESPYYLHAVMIHDGFAESGHYYTFIYDRHFKNWWKFNDHTVSMETEDTVLKESYGGQNQSKSAYCLIYIDKETANYLEQTPLSQYGRQFTLEQRLKKYVQEQNMKFNQEISQFKSDKIVKQIVEKHKSRLNTVNNFFDPKNQTLVQINLINFPVYLRSQQMNTFSRWVILSSCLKEEHPAGMSLMEMPEDDMVYQPLTKFYSNTFLKLSDKERNTLEMRIHIFINYQQSCALIVQILMNLNLDNWRNALQIYLYFKLHIMSKEHGTLNQMPIDANRVFVLFCITQVVSQIVMGNMSEALKIANVAAVDAVLMLETSDIHFKWALTGLERAYKLAKKSKLFNSDYDKQFSSVMSKIKKGNLDKDDKIVPMISAELKNEIDKIKSDFVFDNWVEAWDPDSLAFRYFNIVQEYRAKYEAWIQLHKTLFQRKSVYSEEEMWQFEKSLGVDVKTIK